MKIKLNKRGHLGQKPCTRNLVDYIKQFLFKLFQFKYQNKTKSKQ